MSKRPVIVDEAESKEISRPPLPLPPLPTPFVRPFVCVGMARGPLGWVAVSIKVDEHGKLVSLSSGRPQTFPEYISAEAKKLLHHACLVTT